MDSTRWEKVQSLFHRAAELPPEAQAPFLEEMCAGDQALIVEVAAMLRHDAGGSSLLDRDVADLAGRVMGEGVAPALADQMFGPYRLTRVLGEGGMGVVCLGVRDDLGSVAAIKILRDAWMSPARRERFASEQRILAQLNHPAIARLYDADTLPGGTPWLAMEYVEGVPLTQHCRAAGSSAADRIRLFRGVCEAVQHAHRHLVVHRDLKPSNILVTRDGLVKLLDFGISRRLDAIDRAAAPTLAAARLLTPAYAAPEQIRGEATTVQTDVYALGVILYELLAGRTPFDIARLPPAEGERTLLEDEPPRPSLVARRHVAAVTDLSAAAWGDLDVVCLTAMQKDPAQRYGSVEALIRDIDHYLASEPLEARPDTIGYRARKFVRRKWRPALAAAIVLSLAVALVAFYTVRLAAARNAAVAQAVRTDRIQRFMLKLFDGGEKDAGPADNLRVVTLVDRGVLEAQALDREPLVQAELYQTLGSIYQKLGKFDQADTLLRESLETRRSHLASGAPDVARGLTALALLRSDQARFDDAERLAREGLTSARSMLRADDPQIATATAALGQILEQRGAYPQAIAMLEDAVRLRSGPGTVASDLAAALYDLANTHFYAGHYDVSESLNRRVLSLHQGQFGDAHPLVAEDLINLGAIQYERGRYVDAERFYRQALDINRTWYGKDSYRTASNLTMLGRCLYQEKRYDEAHDLLAEALAVQEHVFGKVHPRVASALNDLGNVAMGRNRLTEAEEDFRRIGEIYRSVYGKTHYLVGIATSNLAGVYMARNDYATAERMYGDAAALFAQTQSPTHLNTGIARIKLGRSLLRQGRPADAERELKAGYDIVTKQAAPTVSWLKSARDDLATAYDALNRPAEAARYRDEAARVAQAGVPNK
jgi:serine/threonine protein kinase/tetratricopeptide (TPR) repeat protein